jgi:hypothetical protein
MSSDAVIFIPGIKGTKLVETNRAPFDTIWSGIQSNFETIEHLELTLGSGRAYYDERIQTIIGAGEIEELAYAEFLRDLETNKPRFIFNYDWRYSSAYNGARLAEFIDYLIRKSDAAAGIPKFKTFDFVTHSLGNFVLRNYMHRQGTGRIGKIVLTVPPFKGSIDIVSAAIIGEGFFPNVRAKIRKLIRGMPGALELLPTYDGASRFDPAAMHSFFNFNHWQRNITSGDAAEVAKMKRALADARRVVANNIRDLATLPQSMRDRILIIARHGYANTYQSVLVHKKGVGGTDNFVDLEHAYRSEHGDGRVPHASSCVYFGKVNTLMVLDSPWHREYSHGFVLKDERVQQLVNRFLFGRKKFSHFIPGNPIKPVTGLVQQIDAASGLAHWEAQF